MLNRTEIIKRSLGSALARRKSRAARRTFVPFGHQVSNHIAVNQCKLAGLAHEASGESVVMLDRSPTLR
jgi:hypothetical protein